MAYIDVHCQSSTVLKKLLDQVKIKLPSPYENVNWGREKRGSRVDESSYIHVPSDQFFLNKLKEQLISKEIRQSKQKAKI